MILKEKILQREIDQSSDCRNDIFCKTFYKVMTVPCGGVFGSTKSGLQARWGSGKRTILLISVIKSHDSLSFLFLTVNSEKDFDLHIPRAPRSKTALPESVRRQMGLSERRNSVSTIHSVNDEKDKLVGKQLKKAKSLYKIQKRTYLKKGDGKETFLQTPNHVRLYLQNIA